MTQDAVNHPAHYGGDTVYEVIKVMEQPDVILAWTLGGDTLSKARDNGVQLRCNHFYGCPQAARFGHHRPRRIHMPPSEGRGSSVSDRARGHLSAVDAQDGLFDREFDDTGLEALLDQREDRKAKRLAAAKAFKDKDDLVKARLAEFDLAEGEVARVGKYRIENKRTPGGHREFDVGASTRLNIKLFE